MKDSFERHSAPAPYAPYRHSKIANHVRVLMLGWEYPPRLAGGLGKACQGLAQGMAKRGAKVFFVLPTFPERVTEPHLEVVGARECALEAGWDPERGRFQERSVTEEAVSVFRVGAELHPYGAAPEGPVPERIIRMFTEVREREAPSAGQRARPSGTGASRPAGAARPYVKTEIYGKNLWSEIERFAATVKRLSDTHDVDVVHAHDWMTFPAAFEFSRMTGAPVFLHVHATEYDRSGENVSNNVFRVELEGFKRAAHIFTVSRYTAGILERLYGVPRKKITVIYNAPDFPADDGAWTGAGEETARKPQVVFLGRLTFQKGPDHFLRAAQLVAQASPEVTRDARFVICGTGDMMDQLRAQAHRLGIEDRVHFAGFVEPSHVDEILRSSKVLVMPSVSEPFGLVALEAIRCGIPTIISKQSGVREVLHRALQVDFWDHEKLADQILAALRLPDLSMQLVADGMDQVRALSWEKSAQKVIQSYQHHLGSTYARAIEGAHGH